jgi:hypothetical protein
MYCSSCEAATFSGAAVFCIKCGTRLSKVPASHQRTARIARVFPPAVPIQPIQLTVRFPKIVGLALLQSFLFSPPGLLYATIKGCLVMIAVEFFGGIFIFFAMVAAGRGGDAASAAFLGALALLWLFALACNVVCVVSSMVAAQSYNREIPFNVSAGVVDELELDRLNRRTLSRRNSALHQTALAPRTASLHGDGRPSGLPPVTVAVLAACSFRLLAPRPAASEVPSARTAANLAPAAPPPAATRRWSKGHSTRFWTTRRST